MPLTELFEPTTIPSNIQERVFRHFKHRRICSDDDEFFVDEFQDKVMTVEHQFLELLRNESVEYDPMVAEYMERIITDESNRTVNETEGGTINRDRNGEDSHIQGGVDTVVGEGAKDTKHTRNLKAISDKGITYEGSEVVHDDYNDSNTREDTSGYDIKREDSGDRAVNNSGQSSQISDGLTLQGQTPDSQTYGAGSSISLKSPGPVTPETASWPEILHEIGTPAKADWKYAGSQAETVSVADSVNRGSEASKESSKGEEHRDNRGEIVDTAKGDLDRRRSFEDRKDHEHKEDDLTGGEDYGQEYYDSKSTTYGKTITDKYGRKDLETRELNQEKKEEGKGERKEQYSGRHQAPPELLEKSRAFIMRSNAVKWLFEQLESVFYSILNPEGW